MIIIRGADGVDAYKKPLDDSVSLWQSAAKKAKLEQQTIKGSDSKKKILESLDKTAKGSTFPQWIIYVGHGTYLDGQAKLNLNGDDLSVDELKKALIPFKQEIIFINTASTSAPFLTSLSFPGRIIITATKNARQVYYTKFNEFMAKAIASPEADLDKDGQTSLLESFLTAGKNTHAFYEDDKRLRGEDALLDDNGDQLGTGIQQYKGLTPAKPSKKIDGFRASQIYLLPNEEEASLDPEIRQERDSLEKDLYHLKLKKETLSEEEYFQKLEVILKKISDVYIPDSDK